jgi:hypothetical protein
VTWETMKIGLHARYGPMQYNDFFGDLTKYDKPKLSITIKDIMSDC